MVTIKDIARLANVSPSTVSIILNGKTKQRKISEETEKKVLKIIAETGYKQNVQASNLRTSRNTSLYRIMIFWIADSRAQYMLRFFRSIENYIMEQNISCEVLLRPYKLNQLEKSLTEDLILSCHGIIVCNASETDLEWLEQKDIFKPLVLYNRYSSKYAAVTMDDQSIGTIPAQIFASIHRKHPLMIASPATFNGMNIRMNLFSYTCIENNMPQPLIYYTSDTHKGGYEITKTALAEHPETDCILYSSDILTIGSLRALAELKIKIPEDISIISIGTDLKEICETSYPSISVVYLPIEEMATNCMDMLYHLMAYQELPHQTLQLPIQYIPRESCPENHL